jgi:hypothetical protein
MEQLLQLNVYDPAAAARGSRTPERCLQRSDDQQRNDEQERSRRLPGPPLPPRQGLVAALSEARADGRRQKTWAGASWFGGAHRSRCSC